MSETYIRLRYDPVVTQDGDLCLVICNEFGLAGNGADRPQAIRNLNVAIRSYCQALDRGKQLWRALQESGIQWEELPIQRAASEVVLDLEPVEALTGKVKS